MKKIMLIAAIVIGLSGSAYCAQAQQPSNTQSDIHQKACQNIFSFVNVDLSLMSPRGAATDVSMTETTKPASNDKIVPISDKRNLKPEPPKCPEKMQNKDTKSQTSLFRLDLLHIIKIQLF